jgi:Ca-activated chloride channel family protein
MKITSRISLMSIMLAFVLAGDCSPAMQREQSRDKTLSPYFFIKSDDPSLDRLPLKSTFADVRISGVIADITVTQVYRNEGKRPLEAIYTFPASTRAAVYGMKMTIGERVINARIDKREEARQQYEDAKQQGRSASLLEQQRPNVFQMNVANIMPGDVINVELSYTELIVPTDRIYEFVYPTVVGPRYSNQPAEGAPSSEAWIENPYLHQDESPDYTFDINVNIATGVPLRELVCASHKVNVHYNAPSAATVRLDPSEKQGGNRDYVLKYRLDGARIQSGLLLHEGEDENFFLLMLEPPTRVTASAIPRREYIFIVDVSGSMHGFPLDISKKLLVDLISNLTPSDKFNVLLFSGGNSVLSEESLPATPENVSRAISLIEREQGGGGTELLPALTRALALPKAERCSRTVIIATDGYVSVEKESFAVIRNNLGNANMFAFGIGSSVNRYIIEGMARAGMGEPFIVTSPEEAPARAEAFRTMIQSPVLTGISVDFAGFDAYDVEPPTIPDVLAERPVIIFGKWRGAAQGKITLSGVSGDRPYSDAIDVKTATPRETNSALRYLWARHRIAILSDDNALAPEDERTREVTNLGLMYNLLTAYTSFVAIDTQIRNKDGETTMVQQPLPLPQGVSDYAIGGVHSYSAAACIALPEHQAERLSTFKVHRGAAQKGRARVALKPGEIDVSGGLSEEMIRMTLERHVHELERCHANGSVGGEIVIELLIDALGTVKDLALVSEGSSDKDVESCMIEEIRKLQFPKPKGASEVRVRVSFVVGP